MKTLVGLIGFNSDAAILSTIDHVLRRTDGDLLVIDDGSQDGTSDRVTERMLKESRLNLLSRPARQGVASATLAGFSYALQHGFDLLVTMPADNWQLAETIPEVVRAAQHGGQLVIGCRYSPAHPELRSRPLTGRLGNRLSSWWLRLPVADSTSAFRGWTRVVMQFLAGKPLRARGYAGLIELLVRTQRAGFSVVEIPIPADGSHRQAAVPRWEHFEAIATVTRLSRS